MYWQAFPPGGESDLSARHQQVVLKKKCAAIDTVIQYKAGAGGALLWSTTNQLPPDGVNIVGINLPHMVLQPMEGKVQYKTEDVTPVFWFHYTPDALVVPEEPHQELGRLHQGRQGQARRAEPGRLGPELGQPRGARTHEQRVRREDQLRALQGHRRHDHGGAGRACRRRHELHRVCHQQQGQGARPGGGHGTSATRCCPTCRPSRSWASTGSTVPTAASACPGARRPRRARKWPTCGRRLNNDPR
jgi:hypothetical protein